MSIYRYKQEETGRPSPARQSQAQPDLVPEQYFVHGKKASDLEFFFSQALEKMGHDYRYEYYVRTPYSLPGEDKKVDFIVDQRYPYEIDGEYSHKSAEQKAYDVARDALINDILGKRGFFPIVRVKDTEVDTPEKADQFVEENI